MVSEAEAIYNVKYAQKQTEMSDEIRALRGLLHEHEEREAKKDRRIANLVAEINDLKAENKGLRLEVDLGDSQDRAA